MVPIYWVPDLSEVDAGKAPTNSVKFVDAIKPYLSNPRGWSKADWAKYRKGISHMAIPKPVIARVTFCDYSPEDLLSPLPYSDEVRAQLQQYARQYV
jgi:hypothetical protein